MNGSADRGILDGVRVIELSWGIAGPVAAQLLAEAGADVIKVEPPGGEPSRRLSGFATWNRSKRGIELDLHSPSGLAALHDLLTSADVLIHGLRPSRAQRLGLDDVALAAQYPSLVVASVLGYPIGHPDVERPGYECLVQARMGLMDVEQGHRDGPIFLRFPIATWGAMYLAAIGVLARLLERRTSGLGGAASTSLVQGVLTSLRMHWVRGERGPIDILEKKPQPYPGIMECSDGLWMHLMDNPQVPLMDTVMAELVGDELLPTDPDELHARMGNREQHAIALRKRSSKEWFDEFWTHDIAALPCQRLGEIFFDEQAALAGYVVEVDDPLLGPTRQAGTPFATSPPSRVRSAAPGIGEHTAEILGETRSPIASEPTGRARKSAAQPPLDGIRVLDLGMYAAGPFGPMLMADLGAEVIKLEPPSGDGMRFAQSSFAAVQRGKRSIALDLKKAGSAPVLAALVGWADVVHHNVRMPAAQKLGFDYETVRAINPHAIYCHSSGYGASGPRADWGGYDQLFQAYAGWETEASGPGNPPMWHRMGAMDHQSAMASVVATLLALYERNRTGLGQFVGASILGSAVLTASETFVHPDGSLAPFERLDAKQTGVRPWYRIYQALDDWIAVASWSASALTAILEVAGCARPEELEPALAARTARDLVSALELAGVAAEVVALDQSNAFLDRPEHRTTGLVAELDHPEYGHMEEPGALWHLGDLPLRIDRPTPLIGEHTIEILQEIGFGEHVDALAADGVVAYPRSAAEDGSLR